MTLEQLTVSKSQSNFKELSLGDKIIKTNQFLINVPNGGLLYGIKHLPIIQKVIYVFYNFKQVFRINAEFNEEEAIWKVSNYLIPLSKLLEYSNDLKLDVEIIVNHNKKNKFYTFYAIFDNHLSPKDDQEMKSSMYLSIPTVKDGVEIEYLGNIWRLVDKRPHSPPKLNSNIEEINSLKH